MKYYTRMYVDLILIWSFRPILRGLLSYPSVLSSEQAFGTPREVRVRTEPEERLRGRLLLQMMNLVHLKKGFCLRSLAAVKPHAPGANETFATLLRQLRAGLYGKVRCYWTLHFIQGKVSLYMYFLERDRERKKTRKTWEKMN